MKSSYSVTACRIMEITCWWTTSLCLIRNCTGKAVFQTGPVWVEYLTDPDHFRTNLTDRALGGAQTDGLTPPGLVEQVRAHIVAARPPLSATNLYVIWIGGNDFLNGDGDFQRAVDNINEAVTEIADNGAMSMLILNLPDLGTIPDTFGDQPKHLWPRHFQSASMRPWQT